MGTRCTAAPETPDRRRVHPTCARTLGIRDLGFGIRASFGIRRTSPESRAPSPEPRVPNPESQIPNPVVCRSSSMTRRAARELLNLLLGDEPAPQLEKRAGGKDLRVAVHARSGRGDPGEGRILDRRVAVAAVDAVAGDVSLVAELDRLLARDARLGDPGRAVDLVEEAEQARDDEKGAEDADAGKRVGGAVEDLRHCGSPNFSSLPCLPEVRDTHIVKYFTLWPRLQMWGGRA